MPPAPLVDPRRAPVRVPMCAAIIVFIVGVLLVSELVLHRLDGHPDRFAELAYLALMGPYAVVAVAGMIPRSRPFSYVVALMAGVPTSMMLLLLVVGLVWGLLLMIGFLAPDEAMQAFLYIHALVFGLPTSILLVLYAWAGVMDTPPSLRTGVLALFGMILYVLGGFAALELCAAR